MCEIEFRSLPETREGIGFLLLRVIVDPIIESNMTNSDFSLTPSRKLAILNYFYVLLSTRIDA